jgi:hypothetical protein
MPGATEESKATAPSIITTSSLPVLSVPLQEEEEEEEEEEERSSTPASPGLIATKHGEARVLLSMERQERIRMAMERLERLENRRKARTCHA